MRKIFFVFLYLFIFFLVCYCNNLKYYPKILSLDNNGFNEKLFINYNNYEGKNLTMKIYDTNGILVLEKKVSNTTDEKPEPDGSWTSKIEMNNFDRNVLLQGLYIFTLSDEIKVLNKGSFLVVR